MHLAQTELRAMLFEPFSTIMQVCRVVTFKARPRELDFL